MYEVKTKIKHRRFSWRGGIMKTYIFRVVIESDNKEDGTEAYHAFCPVLKGCHSWGYTTQEALANIKEAVEAYVEDLIKAGEPIPSAVPQEVEVRQEPVVAVTV